MLSQPLPQSAANPFATRFIQPGTLPFLFPPHMDVQVLVRRLESQQWRGQIVGCHGSGKTSLLAALKVPLERHTRVFWYRVDPQRTLAHRLRCGEANVWRRGVLVVIDGFAELSVWTRLWVRFLVQWRQCGLLITTHRPWLTLPVLVELRPTESTFRAVVQQVLQKSPVAVTLDDTVLRRVWDRYGPNMREALFCLYEHVAQTIQANSGSAHCGEQGRF